MINANHKTFDDLVFEDHANVSDAVQSRLDLGNNLEISVVSMKSKSSGFGNLSGNASNGTYEVAVFENGSMVPLSAWDDVIGWQTESQITVLMLNCQGVRTGLPVDSRNFIDWLHFEKSETRADLGLTV